MSGIHFAFVFLPHHQLKMKYFYFLLLLVSVPSQAQIDMQIHCGYDFSSYLVVEVKEEGKQEVIKNLKITLIDSLGNEAINKNNSLSWINTNQPLKFTENYQLASSERWFFPFAKESYLLSITNTFPADNYQLKIEDIDGKENGGHYKTEIIQLYSFNMYVLCSNEGKKMAQQFGPRVNKPIRVVLRKEEN
jgi:hypothetical protein